MWEYVLGIIETAITIGAWELFKHFFMRPKMYKWSCPVKGCNITFKASDRSMLTTMQSWHPPHEEAVNGS